MDGATTAQQRRFPRPIKNIKTETHPEHSAIINVNALLDKNIPHPLPLPHKI
jgi:hypothetical protein